MRYLYVNWVIYVLMLIAFEGASQGISITGTQNYCRNTSISIVTSASIINPDSATTTLNQLRIEITEGYAFGEDVLTLTGLHPNITPIWLPQEGRLILDGPADVSEFETALLAVEFETTQTVFDTDRRFFITMGNANYLPSTEHFYFYVPNLGITWSDARAIAETQTYFGLQGYLATLTSLEEAQISNEQSIGAGWIGASDNASEGAWRWVTGPEAGTLFWQGGPNGNPVNGEFSFWNTGEPNNFGTIEEDYAHITDPSIGISGSWNDLPNEGDTSSGPTNPFFPKGYIIEFGGMPGDPPVRLSATSNLIMPQISTNNRTTCGNTPISLTVDTNTNDIRWYEDQTSSTVINTGTTYTVTPSSTTTYWVQSQFLGCPDTNRIPITVTVNPIPATTDFTITQCDDTPTNGISIFNLSNYQFEASNGITVNRAISFFEDASLSIPINASNYTNLSNNQDIYARVENTTTGCFDVATVTLVVSQPNANSFRLEQCDDAIEDGITEFNLSEYSNQILLEYPTASEISYFTTYEDALLGINALAGQYTNQIQNTEGIQVKIADGNECLGIFSLTLVVNALPAVAEDEIVYYCLNTFPETITLQSGVVNDTPNNYLYNWSTGATTIAIQVNQPDVYTVAITEVDGCTNRRTITVLPSNTATIDAINIEDASDNNSVTISVSGDGAYEYSLDFENDPYQESNTFQNVKAGIRTVYVRDKNGCGVVSEHFPVIGFPKYFTPNGDGQNDFWVIDGFNDAFLNNATVKIFNRSGKLLTVLSAVNPSWDGKYNGAILPTDDYWFSVQLPDGRMITRHFSLRR